MEERLVTCKYISRKTNLRLAERLKNTQALGEASDVIIHVYVDTVQLSDLVLVLVHVLFPHLSDPPVLRDAPLFDRCN